MSARTPEQNKAIVLEAFDALFNRKDVAAAKRFWSPNYVQHSAHVPAGRDGLFGTIATAPPEMRYEHQLAVAEGDYVLLHGRFTNIGQAANWIAVDICRLENGVLVEHWDVIQNEATRSDSAGGHPMFGTDFPAAPMPVAGQDTERAKVIVRSFYEGGANGRITDFADRLAEDFELFVPEYLPWGGQFDKAGYVALLPGVARILDFAKLTYLSFTGEGGHIVALIEIGVQGTDRSIIISEHWDIVADKAVCLRVAYFNPKVLLDRIASQASS